MSERTGAPETLERAASPAQAARTAGHRDPRNGDASPSTPDSGSDTQADSCAASRYFSEIADEWEAGLAQPSPVQPTVVRIAGIAAGAHVLDIGCGTGIMIPHYLEAGADRVLAIDVAPCMVEIARRKHRDDPRVEVACADACALSSDERFDAAVVYNAYPHFLDRAALVRAVAGVLVPGGRFVVAHSMGRAALNAHHSSVPAEVTSDLMPARVEARHWEGRFELDAVVDTPGFYCLSGVLRD